MRLQITVELMISMALSMLLAVSFMAFAGANNFHALSALNWSGKISCDTENFYTSMLNACHGCLVQQSQPACTQAS